MTTAAAAYAAVCAGAAACLTVGRDEGLRRARLVLASGGVVGRGPRRPWAYWRRFADRLRPEWLCLPAGALLAVLGESVLPLLAGAVGVPLAGRRLRASERRRAEDGRAAAVIALCGGIVGELRAGGQPGQALLTVGRATGALGAAEAAVLSAARFGGDVPAELRRASREPGAGGLAGLAACWLVAVDSGAGLATGIDRLEAALRSERDQRAALRAQLAGARSTVVVLALLPVIGLALGWALGADPLRVLLHSPAGLGCLVVGGLLEAAGLYWATRIVRAAERS
ncbi:type II secretion system F family protein [Streptomyces tirandamycinicus]|uniref:type II secretion system F family protein n=1 Tax=Streptomyces tirandamycinicus TaxID=2174846 RepID=UPI002271C190|nr:type II secretion system F family protein [Streptomyces tirandamycinicus]MCY0984795.1 type II secretion system F family protein [Streptomyces tirandamycinicus]